MGCLRAQFGRFLERITGLTGLVFWARGRLWLADGNGWSNGDRHLFFEKQPVPFLCFFDYGADTQDNL